MRKLSLISLLSIPVINLFNASLALSHINEKTTTAIFGSVGSSGFIPIADSPVVIIPCDQIKNKCPAIILYLINKLSEAEGIKGSQFNELDSRIRIELSKLPFSSETRTSFSGAADIPCKVDKCLIYTSFLADRKLFWISIPQKGVSQEYPPSKAVELTETKVPNSIDLLLKANLTLSTRFQAGISYVSLSEAISPYLEALNNAKNDPLSSNYAKLMERSEKISSLISVLSQTWRVYIDGTSSDGIHTTSCETYDKIRMSWNNVLGYEDMTQTKGGLLGCLYSNLDNFTTPQGTTNLPNYMITVISFALEKTYKDVNFVEGIVPEINLSEAQ